MMKTIELKCVECGNNFSKNVYQYTKDVKRGQKNFFCSTKCLSIYFTKTTGINNLLKYETEPPCCLRCKKELTYNQFRNKSKYCSHSCSAIVSNSGLLKTDEVRKKISVSNKEYFVLHGPREWTPDEKNKISNSVKLRWKDWLIKQPFDNASPETKRKIVILEQNNKCNRCLNDKWLDNVLILEIEHKDGNHHNNSRNNLEALCPNCHSLTKTWRGRNSRREGIRVSLTEMVNAYNECGNIRQALLKLKLAAKGGNYKRMKNAILMYS